MNLFVLQYESILIKSMYIQRQAPVSQFKRKLGRRVCTTFFRNKDILHIFFLIESEEATFLRGSIKVGPIESGVCTDLEMHFFIAGILHFPDYLDLFSLYTVAYFQAEGEWILFQCPFIAHQLVTYFIFFL